MPLKMTATRAELLLATSLGEVWRLTNGHSIHADTDPLAQFSDAQVSQQMADMEAAGWVDVLVSEPQGAQQWRLTDAGRSALAAATRKAG
jgi:hypothetical protein